MKNKDFTPLRQRLFIVGRRYGKQDRLRCEVMIDKIFKAHDTTKKTKD